MKWTGVYSPRPISKLSPVQYVIHSNHVHITLNMSIKILCVIFPTCSMNDRIFYRILSVLQNIIMDLNNVMHAYNIEMLKQHHLQNLIRNNHIVFFCLLSYVMLCYYHWTLFYICYDYMYIYHKVYWQGSDYILHQKIT